MHPDAHLCRSTEFSIRVATEEDVPAIRDVLHAVRLEYGVTDHTGDADTTLAELDANYFARGGSFEVVQDADGRIVGCAGLLPLNNARAELCRMYIEKRARGRGLGRRLLEDMLSAARAGGFAEVWLETNSALQQAIRLYSAYGFRPVESDHLLSRCDQAYLLRLK